MKRVILALGAVIFCLGNGRAEAPKYPYFIDGNALYSWCDKKALAGLVAVYAEGVADSAFYTASSPSELGFCIPQGVISGQLGDIVCRGLKQNPQERQKAGGGLVLKYIAQSFPCGQRQ